MRISLIITLCCFFFSFCHSRQPAPDCHLDMSAFKDVYDYPDTVVAADIPILFCQKRQELSRDDSLSQSLIGAKFFNRYKENNLSIGFSGEETFRFTAASSYNFSPVCIRFNRREMIVKICVEGEFDDRYDDSLLTEKEQYDLRFMERIVWVNNYGCRLWKKKYFDSMITADPRLLSADYLLQLYRKRLVDTTCVISTKKIPLTEKQYCSLLKELKATDFGELPWQIKAKYPPTHDSYLILEAHTANKFKYMVCSTSADPLPDVREFCLKLVKMAGLDPKKVRL